MSYKIVVDSCGELTEQMKNSGKFETVSLGIQVGEYYVVDDEKLDQADLLKRIADSAECAKTSCPSPEAYMESYKGEAERVYVIALTGALSGSYNSAVLGKNLYLEEYDEKDIYIFNSCSASVGETLIAMKIQECEEAGMDFQTVIDTVEAYIAEQHTYFVLEDLDTLRKNGRLTGLKAVVATALNIKPYMGATPEGTIFQIGQARGIKKALSKMVDVAVAELQNSEDKVLGITNCNCRERAEEVKAMFLAKAKVKDVVIVDTRGISTVYANDGGIILVV